MPELADSDMVTSGSTTVFELDELLGDDSFGSGIQLIVDVGSITPKKIWDNREMYFEFANKSKEFWDQMDVDKREATTRLVKQGIERIYDRVDDWLPEAMEVEGGNYVDVHFRLLFTNIDEEIERNEEATSFQIKNAAEATLAKLKKND